MLMFEACETSFVIVVIAGGLALSLCEDTNRCTLSMAAMSFVNNTARQGGGGAVYMGGSTQPQQLQCSSNMHFTSPVDVSNRSGAGPLIGAAGTLAAPGNLPLTVGQGVTGLPAAVAPVGAGSVAGPKAATSGSKPGSRAAAAAAGSQQRPPATAFAVSPSADHPGPASTTSFTPGGGEVTTFVPGQGPGAAATTTFDPSTQTSTVVFNPSADASSPTSTATSSYTAGITTPQASPATAVNSPKPLSSPSRSAQSPSKPQQSSSTPKATPAKRTADGTKDSSIFDTVTWHEGGPAVPMVATTAVFNAPPTDAGSAEPFIPSVVSPSDPVSTYTTTFDGMGNILTDPSRFDGHIGLPGNPDSGAVAITPESGQLLNATQLFNTTSPPAEQHNLTSNATFFGKITLFNHTASNSISSDDNATQPQAQPQTESLPEVEAGVQLESAKVDGFAGYPGSYDEPAAAYSSFATNSKSANATYDNMTSFTSNKATPSKLTTAADDSNITLADATDTTGTYDIGQLSWNPGFALESNRLLEPPIERTQVFDVGNGLTAATTTFGGNPTKGPPIKAAASLKAIIPVTSSSIASVDSTLNGTSFNTTNTTKESSLTAATGGWSGYGNYLSRQSPSTAGHRRHLLGAPSNGQGSSNGLVLHEQCGVFSQNKAVGSGSYGSILAGRPVGLQPQIPKDGLYVAVGGKLNVKVKLVDVFGGVVRSGPADYIQVQASLDFKALVLRQASAVKGAAVQLVGSADAIARNGTTAMNGVRLMGSPGTNLTVWLQSSDADMAAVPVKVGSLHNI